MRKNVKRVGVWESIEERNVCGEGKRQVLKQVMKFQLYTGNQVA